MNLTQRCRVISIGVISWYAVAALMITDPTSLTAASGPLHAGIAGSLVALGLLPRRMVGWFS